MKKAGGITALVAGIFGILAAGVTLFVGGVGHALNQASADTVLWLGWGGVAFSFAVIVLGAVAISATSRWVGGLLILASIGGVILGGTFVAVFMALSLVGGILALAGKRSAPAVAG